MLSDIFPEAEAGSDRSFPMASDILPYDVLVYILEEIVDDHQTLYSCSLVNWPLNKAASKLLYARVEYSPSFRPVLDLRDRGDIPVNLIYYHTHFNPSDVPCRNHPCSDQPAYLATHL